MNTYTFRINAVDAKVSLDGLSNVIERVHYTHIATNPDGVVVSRNDVVMLPAPQPEAFVPADQLVQADVIEWIKPLIDLEAQQAGLDSHMAEKVAPTQVRLTIPESQEPVIEETATEDPVVEE